MTPSEFTLKWEKELQTVTSQWEYSARKGYHESELIEGARMQGISLMLEEFYETFQIIPLSIREFPEQVDDYQKRGWLLPTAE